MAQESPLDKLSTADRNFAQNLYDMRTKRGLSQEAVAEKMRELGWEKHNQMTVSRTEKGTRTVSIGEARALGHILGGVGTEQMVAPAESVKAVNEALNLKARIDDHVTDYVELLSYVQTDLWKAQELLGRLDLQGLDDMVDGQTVGRLRNAVQSLQKRAAGGVSGFKAEAESHLYDDDGGIHTRLPDEIAANLYSEPETIIVRPREFTNLNDEPAKGNDSEA